MQTSGPRAPTPDAAEPAASPGTLKPRRRRLYIGLAVLACAVIAYLLAGFAAVPYLARTQLQSFVKKQYGRDLQVRAIHFNPITFRLEALGVSLPDADGGAMLGFERFAIQPSVSTLWRFAPVLREIILEAPHVHAVVRPDGTLNLADLGKGFDSGKPAAAPPQGAQAPMRLYIGRFQVVAGAGELEDRTLPGPFIEVLQPVNFDLRDFSTRGGTDNLYQLTAASASGAQLKWSGNFALQPLASHGSFELTGLPLHTLWSYAHSPLAVAVPPGTLALRGQYDAALKGGTAALKVQLPEITLSGLKLKPENAPSDYVDLPQIQVQNTRVDLEQRSVDIGAVISRGGSINAWVAPGGRINLMEMLPAASAGPSNAASPDTHAAATQTGHAAPAAVASAAPAAAPADAGAPWRVSVPDIQVQQLKIAAEDREVSPAAQLSINPLNVKVAGFTTAPGARLDVTVNTALNGAPLSADAQVSPGSNAVTAHLDLNGLDLRALQPYLTAQTGMTLLSGKAGTKIGFERNAAGAMSVTGDVDVSELRTVDDEAKADFMRWKDLHVSDIQYASQPATLKIGTISARAPYARVIIFPDLTTNISEILTPKALLHGRARRVNDNDSGAAAPPGPAPAAAAATPAKLQSSTPVAQAPKASPQAKKSRKDKTLAAKAGPAPAAPFPVSIKKIELTDASANYADHWIQPNFAVGIQTLNGTVTGLSSDPKSRAQVRLDGKVDRYAPVHIGGQINVLSAMTYSDIQMSFKGLDLTTVTPYSGRFAGYKIDKGNLSIDLGYKVDNRQLAAQQHFVVNQLQLGDPVESKDAVKLPLKLALALLKDRNGVIDLDLPMTGSLDDPQFQIGPLIWKTLLNILEKAVTAPFAALGHLFGGGETMNVIEFAPGSSELDDGAKTKVNSLIKALNERPALQLDVPAAFVPDLDRPPLAQAQLQQQIMQQPVTKVTKKSAPASGAAVSPSDEFRLVLAAYRAQMKGAPLPPSALQASKSKAADAATFAPAIQDLEAPLLQSIQVPDSALERLGEKRAQAIEDLLVAGGVDPTRVFVVKEQHASSKEKPTPGKVPVEMALK